MAGEGGRPQFGQWYDEVLAVGAEGNQAFFGRDVLTGLVQGIKDFRAQREPRWTQYRGVGTTMLGCAMWMDDPELINELARLSAACVVVSKQPRDRSVQPPAMPHKLRRLAELNERARGIPVRYFRQLEE